MGFKTCCVASEDVVVFPLSKSRLNDGTIDMDRTRLLTEKSVSNIINQLIDTNGFVISKEDSATKKVTVEFNLMGYYFRVTLDFGLNEIKEALNGTEVYANIYIDGYQEIQGQDNEGKYEGLILSKSPIYSASLLILERTSTNSDKWEIPTSSRRRFDLSSLGINGIDGKYKW